MSTSRAAQVERSTTRILRDKGIDPSIKCTSTLVADYNAEEDAKVREVMRIWLDTLIDEFSKISPGSIPKKTITEFMNLAEIKAKEPADAELVRRVYTTVRHIVMGEKEGCSVYFVLALEYILSILDQTVLQQDARTLVALADHLIEMTDPKKMPLTRDTFEYHGSCLNAFERVLMVLHDLEKERSDKPIVKYFEDKTKKHLDMIISCQRYYPFAYQAFLIKENIKTLLEKDTKTLLLNAGRRAFYAFCGGPFIFQGVRELAVMKLDFSAMESGIGKFREAFKGIGWYSMTEIQEIVSAASETVEHDDFGIFQQYYNLYQNVSWREALKWRKQKMIRYTLVSHLCLFRTEKHSRSNQDQALDLLVRPAIEEEGKQWRNDQQIFEAIIEALIAVGKRNQDHRPIVINALNTIGSSQNAPQKKVVNGFLEGKTPDQIVKSDCLPQEDDANCALFNRTRETLDLRRTHSDYEQNQQTLKDYYEAHSFAKVSLFSDKNDQRHIKTFDFNLEQYEKVVVSRDHEDQSSQADYNQRENNKQRTMKVRKPIKMQDLFKSRGTSAHGFQSDAKRILVIGNPGTGKTCLSKRLCFDWATGSWGTKFTHVYLLPIRRLTESSVGTDVDLPLIIRQVICKTSATQDDNNALYKEIKDNLFEATTLLILDGYDEAGQMAMDLVSSAFALNCSLLIFSRPHSVNDIRPRVGIEVECLEFSNKQLESFLSQELGSKDGDDLIKFLNANLSIKDTCRTAVNVQIIARLWMSSYKEKLIKSSCANLTRFYSLISKYMWTRFRDKEDSFDMNKTFDSLELVAFESFKEGKVEIPRDLIMDHAPESLKVFQDSGFLLFMEEGTVFQFAHLTFHEYFAGCHLAKMLKSNDREERQVAKRFISEHKYIETSQVMLSFMTQYYCMRDDIEASLEAFKDLMQVLESDSMPSISLQHSLLRIRTLDAFLPCGLDEPEVVQTNDMIVRIVDDAMDALKRWFGFEMGVETGKYVLCRNPGFSTPLIDGLARMPNLFKRFYDLLKPILLNENGKRNFEKTYRRNIARVGRLNSDYALQCILPILDNGTVEEQICMIELCALVGPSCAKATFDHLKRLCKDQHPRTRRGATSLLLSLLDLFPEREDVRQLVLNASRDSNEEVRFRLVFESKFAAFTPETKAGTFIWDILLKAIKDNSDRVRSITLASCVEHYQTFAKSVDEVMEFVREFAISSNVSDRIRASYVIRHLIDKAPKKSEELLVLVKVLCKDDNFEVRESTVQSLKEMVENFCLRREDLSNVAFDLFKHGYSDVQLEILPFLFSVDHNEINGIDEVNEWIATCQNLDGRVQEKASLCNLANALLSKYTIEEIHDKFDEQDKEVQLEIAEQFHLREIESNNAIGAIVKIALQCLEYDRKFQPSWIILKRLSKTKLLPHIVLEQLANGRDGYMVREQPLSHLLDYYWSTKDLNMIQHIAEKLLLSAVVFEKKGETETEVTLREKGANVKQTAPVEVVQNFLSLCKDCLKEKYGLGFP